MLKIFICLFVVSEVFSSNFTCFNGGSIDASKICDGLGNCSDLSDERAELCASIICKADEFKCYYGACINRENFCNNISDCIDGSDEFNCGKSNTSCDPGEFRCSSSNHCIDSSLICNQIRDCPAGEDEAQICQPQSCHDKTFHCGYGRCIDRESVCDNFNDCINGDDESDLLCKTLSCFNADCTFPTCPPIKSTRLNVKCFHKNIQVDCDKNIQPETEAKYSCREFYQPESEFHMFNDKAICQQDGRWSTEILKCEPKCGYLKESIPLIVHGFSTEITFPWHATLFIKRGNEFMFACGATLITELVVLSAAHCFAHVNESEVKIAIGARHSNFTESLNKDSAKYFDAQRIIRHPLYLDVLGNYGSDIALVELNETVTLNYEIHPACIDWELDDITSHLTRNQLGTIVGMGVTENDTNSEVIRMTLLPIVANEDCIKLQPRDFQKFVTFTTFCAGWGNGTSLCNGDSGGGLMFLSRDLKTWKVQGIVSLSPRRQSTFFCDPYKFTVFTKVGLYVKWIKFILNNIHNTHTEPLEVVEYEPIL
ncbi:CLUMA_CG010863, isoform A [Clunio marinus]|uniref:CLUMA_CG010863, isoform A n=1 Tax=Clunio marinus TaxID=568069 RepID=A0A1J1ICJ1_9DIPT|nr:CLUMA_CG010863, isoform A [Clunio marinus]